MRKNHTNSCAESSENIIRQFSRLVYVTRNYKSTAYGGAKARVDMEDILHDMGAVNLGMKRTFCKNKAYDYFRNLAGIMRFMCRVRPGDVVLVQYPVKKYYKLICRWSHMRGAKVVSLIHDLGSFRRHRLTVKEENRKLQMSDVIIPANVSTIKWLREHGCDMPMTPQIAWDYLLKNNGDYGEKKNLSVAFVGDLKESRNGFLYKLPEKLETHIYGNGAKKDIPEHIKSHGFIHPEDFVRQGEGKYGLIWYGPTLKHDTEGYIGEYISYCNPHKLGLYMRAGIPVILWEGAGAAPFVKKEGIGVTVESLENLDKQLASISDEDYSRMQANVKRVASLMAYGYYFRSALDHALDILQILPKKLS